MSDIESKAVQGNSERVWETNEFQSRKQMRKLTAVYPPRRASLFSLGLKDALLSTNPNHLTLPLCDPSPFPAEEVFSPGAALS
jgi:hypothetical protein